tara:strand:+ start:249 stop:512 length:264 start_codon:yes stop_codon:yes gene_type:complete
MLQDHLKPEVMEQHQLLQIHRQHILVEEAEEPTLRMIQEEMVEAEAEAEVEIELTLLQQERLEPLTQAVAEELEGFPLVQEQPVVVE